MIDKNLNIATKIRGMNEIHKAIEDIYKAAYNEAIEDSIRAFRAELDIDEILKLKKE